MCRGNAGTTHSVAQGRGANKLSNLVDGAQAGKHDELERLQPSKYSRSSRDQAMPLGLHVTCHSGQLVLQEAPLQTQSEPHIWGYSPPLPPPSVGGSSLYNALWRPLVILSDDVTPHPLLANKQRPPKANIDSAMIRGFTASPSPATASVASPSPIVPSALSTH